MQTEQLAPRHGEMNVVTVGPVRLAQMRRNPFGSRLPSGWILFDDTNLLRDEVLLVSTTEPVVLGFPFEKPYHSVMRARIRANAYAEKHPQTEAATEEVCA